MAPAAPRSEHHLIITRAGSPPAAPEVLLVREAAGWALPCIESQERRSADVAPLNRSARERLGVEISVLRCLRDGPADANAIRRQVYEAEAHADRDSAPSLGAWLGAASLDATPLTVPTKQLLEAWLAERRVRGPSGERGEWELTGWRDRATAWALAELCRQRATRIVEIEQLRVWEYSCVLRLGTDDGDLYLKALPRAAATETRLTRRLAETHPRWTAPVVAVEPERGRMLTRAVRGPALMGVRDLARWTQAADACARIQIDWLERASELETLGCPSRSLEWLEAEIGPLLEDESALLAGHPEGLDAAEIERLRQRQPALEAACRELAGYGLPAALEHGDLWAENVIAAPDASVLIDWEDAVLAHPFFSPSLLLLSLDHTEALADVPDARARIREAYLAPWRATVPARIWPAGRIETAFDLAQRLAMLHYAVQFRRFALPRIETSWEVRTYAPLFLRHLLDPSDPA
jgi:hypothetical protein